MGEFLLLHLLTCYHINMLDFYFNEEPGPYRMQCNVIFITVLPRKRPGFFLGIYSDTFIFFSPPIHCNAWGGSRRGTCQSLPLIPWFPLACALTSATCGTHQITPTGKNQLKKASHLQNTNTHQILIT